MKSIVYSLFVLSGLPLVTYPAVLLAGIMSIAGERSHGTPLLLNVVATTFQIGSIAYPAIYFPFLRRAQIKLKTSDNKGALRFSLVPLGYLLALGALFAAWSALGERA